MTIEQISVFVENKAGRLAETKLSVPLMILVLDLIGVTCAPALLQM